MNYPKISIITPSYNQGQYIEATILSVLGQLYPNLEYFVYDAKSTDNTLEVIKKYEDKITFWVSEKDEGQADAINKGFNKATGDILMWLNSDDMLMPNTLNFIAESYLKNGDGIYFGNCIHFKELDDQNGIYTQESNVIKNFNTIPLSLVDTIIQPSSFWSRSVWLKNGALDANRHFGFDWEWFLRAEQNDIAFYPLNRPLSMYRFHDEHKTGVGGEKRQDELYEIFNLYNPKYARLYNLVRHEKYEFSFFQKLKIKTDNMFSKKRKSLTYYLQRFKKEYKEFSVEDIEHIKYML